MVLRLEVIEERLKELDTVLNELARYKDKKLIDIQGSLSLRWTIERGLIAAATLVFDIADHIVSAHFGLYAETYRESLQFLHEKGVISDQLFEKIKGLGGLRNILVHEYLRVDLRKLFQNFQTAFETFPMFSKEIQDWLKKLEKR